MFNIKKNRIIFSLIILIILIISVSWYFIFQQKNINDLYFRIDSLQYQNDVLASRCNILESNISSIFQEYENELSSLENEHTLLKTQLLELTQENDIQKYEITRLNENYDIIEQKYFTYVNQYKQLREKINSRLGFEGNLSDFITPLDQLVFDTMYEVSGGLESWGSIGEFWEDSMLIYNWIIENIDYAIDSPYPYLYPDPNEPVKWFSESVKYPNETLFERAGDCEDQAILLVSMLYAHNDIFTSWCFNIQWEGGGHVGVGIPLSGNRLSILDPSGKYYSGSENTLVSENVFDAIENWMTHIGDKEMKISSIFNNSDYIEFENNQEFYTWFNIKYP
jgi:hypothetical protein